MLSEATHVGDRWRSLPQQDFFVLVLKNLGRKDRAAANFVSRSWHIGIHERVTSLWLRCGASFPLAAGSGVGQFSALTSLTLSYTQADAAFSDRKEEYQRVAAALSTLQLRVLTVQGLAAAPSDFAPLGTLTGLHTLHVNMHSTPQAATQDSTLLAALSELRQLRDLSISESKERDLTALMAMPKLQRLVIGLHPDADLSTAGCLHQLTKLDLRATSAAQRRQLTAVSSLRILDGLQVDGDRDVSYLAGMTTLKLLSLGCNGSSNHRVDMAGLGSLRSLETLSLSKVSFEMTFRPLFGLTALRSLMISGTATLEVQFMGSLQQLTHLSLSVTAVLDPMHLSHLGSLRQLHLECQHLTVFSWLSRLTSLRSLTLHTPLLHDLAPLSRLLRLEVLWLKGCMTSLDHLSGLRLQQLSLTNCWQLTGLSALTNMTPLQLLYLSMCPGSATRGLSDLTSLTALIVVRTPLLEAESLSSLTSLRDLELFDPFPGQAEDLGVVLPWVEIAGW